MCCINEYVFLCVFFQSPTFLMFLDCVWQLTQQFPSVFQFSETYLTALWDSVCIGLFDSFIFDHPCQRSPINRFTMYTSSTMPQQASLSVWDWSLQYAREEYALFYNPLYLASKEIDLDLSETNKIQKAVSAAIPDLNRKLILRKIYTRKLTETWEAVPEAKSDVLKPVIAAPLIEFWSHCYLRWVTPHMLLGGGTPAQYLQQCILVEEIICLKHKLKTLKSSTPYNKSNRPNSELLFSPNVSTPNRRIPDKITSSYPYAPTATIPHLSYLRGAAPVSQFAKHSLILDTTDEERSCDELESSVDSMTLTGGATGRSSAEGRLPAATSLPSPTPMERGDTSSSKDSALDTHNGRHSVEVAGSSSQSASSVSSSHQHLPVAGPSSASDLIMDDGPQIARRSYKASMENSIELPTIANS